MPESDPPIVITGGSVTIEFHADELLAEVAADGLVEGKVGGKGKTKHTHPDKTLKRITIRGDGIDYSKDFPTGQGVRIEVFYD